MRIAKFIANSGICSRRDAEKKILNGEVSVNGEVVSSPALNVQTDDEIKILGQSISEQKPRLWIYHKPVGLVTSHKDEKSRETVFSSLKDKLPRVISVGRLDLQSEGLLLLTNNGELARKFELPGNAFDRVYKVKAIGDSRILLNSGLKFEVDAVKYKFKSIKKLPSKNRDSSKSDSAWYIVILQEGKNREIRRVFSHYGLKIKRLIRIEYAGYELGSLKPGQFKEVNIYQ